jgi:hypothetical protein
MRKIITFLLLLNSLFVFAGENVRVKGQKFILHPFVSIISQRPLYGRLDIGHPYAIHYDTHRPWFSIVAFSKLGGEFNFNFTHKIWAPESSSEIVLGFICLRANVADFFESGQRKFYFMPEAGLTWRGYFTLVAGYNMPWDNTGFSDIAGYRISFNWMAPFFISGSSKDKQK